MWQSAYLSVPGCQLHSRLKGVPGSGRMAQVVWRHFALFRVYRSL